MKHKEVHVLNMDPLVISCFLVLVRHMQKNKKREKKRREEEMKHKQLRDGISFFRLS